MVVDCDASCRQYVGSEISSVVAVSFYQSLDRNYMIHNVV